MIIGITGTLGAGKGTVVEYLVQRRGMMHYSVREFLVEELQRRRVPRSRDTMVALADEFREKHSPSYIMERLYERAAAEARGAIIESVRAMGEAAYLRSRGAKLWAVDADTRIRYERIRARASETDHVSFEKFRADEEREYHSKDLTKGNIRGVMEIADVTFLNHGTLEELHEQIERALDGGLL